METLHPQQQNALLAYLPNVKANPNEWVLAEVYRAEGIAEEITAARIAELVERLFREFEGRILICNKKEILVLIKWGSRREPKTVGEEIIHHLPKGICDVTVHPTLASGLRKIQMRFEKQNFGSPLFLERAKREQNVILVADDDMYMRALMKKAAGSVGTIVEAMTGDVVAKLYAEHNPDIVFLDIHLPGMDGKEVLGSIHALDQDSFIVMVSADSSVENVRETSGGGAKGFMAKPFTKDKLHEYLKKCPTITYQAAK